MEHEVEEELEQLKRDIARQEAEKNALELELKDLRREFEQYRRERQEEEARRLKTALIAAGGVIITLAGFVWYEIIWPVVKSGINR